MNKPAPAMEDAAWITVKTPFTAAFLLDFINDAERIIRINSLMVFSSWQQETPDSYRISGKNLSTGKNFDTVITVERLQNGVVISYRDGLKAATRIELAENGSDIIITDDYSAVPAAERESRLEEVDKSLIQWGHDIHRYLKNRKRYGFIPGYKYYMDRYWQFMKPSTRRICAMLIMVTVAEFILFLAVFSVFWLEIDRFLD